MPSAVFDPFRPSPRRSDDEGDQFLLNRAGEDLVDVIGIPPARCAIVGDPGVTVRRWLDAHGVVPDRLDERPLQVGAADAILADPAYRDAVGRYDLVLAAGVFERSNAPDLAAAVLGGLLASGGRLAGAIVGGGSLSALRDALLAVDREAGRAAIRIHPMIDGSGLAGLLAGAGLGDPVVTVDRVRVRYGSFDRLVSDLRRMGCSRRLVAPSPSLTKSQWRALRAGVDGPFTERFDLLHFHALKADA